MASYADTFSAFRYLVKVWYAPKIVDVGIIHFFFHFRTSDKNSSATSLAGFSKWDLGNRDHPLLIQSDFFKTVLSRQPFFVLLNFRDKSFRCIILQKLNQIVYLLLKIPSLNSNHYLVLFHTQRKFRVLVDVERILNLIWGLFSHTCRFSLSR